MNDKQRTNQMRIVTEADLKDMVGKVVVFGDGVENLEGYAEPGMRARITTCQFDNSSDDPKEVSHLLTADFREFDVYNRRFESSSYYDEDGKPVLTARQAGFYQLTETLHLGGAHGDLPFAVDEALTLEADEALPQGLAMRESAIMECVQVLRESGHGSAATSLSKHMQASPWQTREEDPEGTPKPPSP